MSNKDTVVSELCKELQKETCISHAILEKTLMTLITEGYEVKLILKCIGSTITGKFLSIGQIKC